MDNTEITINTTTDNISVVVDTEGPNIYPLADFITNLLNTYPKIESATTSVLNNSSTWFNYEEVEEVNTLQSLSGSWQEATDVVNLGVVDGGYF